MVSQEHNRTSILIVDDEVDITEVISYNLKKNGYSTDVAFSAEEALEKIYEQPFELIILDLMLPGMSGLDLCRILKMKKETGRIPIIMVTAKGAEEDIVKGLEMGADDYVTKPFSPNVLMARIKAVLKRNSNNDNKSDEINLHNVSVNMIKREVRVDGKTITLTFTEFEILKMLINHPGWVFTRSQIVDKVRGEDYIVTERSVDVQLFGLRKKLESAGHLIETIRGVGYRFTDS